MGTSTSWRTIAEARDAAVADAYRASLAPLAASSRIAVIAAGAYGRGELFPYSELEIVILHEGQAGEVNDAAAQFLGLLRESGVRPNHHVRTVEQALDSRDHNFELALNLLDHRIVAGDPEVHEKLKRGLAGFYAKHGQRLVRHACAAARARHAKYDNTPYHVQPDVSEAPGGFKDTVLIGRLARLHEIPESDADERERATAFLASVLCGLHHRSHENRNVLDTPPEREYYANVRIVFREARHALDGCERDSTSLLDTFREWQARLSNEEFTISRERVFLRRPAALESDPEMALRLMEFVAQHGIPAAAEAERRLEAAKRALAGLTGGGHAVWPAFRRILMSPHAALAIRTLRYAGVMDAIFPEWADIEGRVDAETERRVTADEFAARTVERIGELRLAGDARRQRFSELLSEVEDSAVLQFALLFHETGKGAREATNRAGMPAGDADTVEFLIEHQLDLSDALRGRDLDDPSVARLLADRIGTVERLKLLTVFSYAVIAAADPDAMTAWRFDQLWRTYLMVQHEFTHELETDRIQELPASLVQCADFFKGFPVRYLRSHGSTEVQGHWRLFVQSRPTGVAVQLDRVEEVYRLTVVARDLPGLFASFAGAISSFGLDIVKAEAFSNSKGVILDTFIVADPKRTLELNPPETERLTDMMRRVALGKTDARRLLRGYAQADVKKRTIAPDVRFDSDASPLATLVEIVAEDRPGLLYSLATVFSSSGCNIDVVLIDTKGRRAIDVFYVAQDGGKLTTETQDLLKERLLAAC